MKNNKMHILGAIFVIFIFILAISAYAVNFSSIKSSNTIYEDNNNHSVSKSDLESNLFDLVPKAKLYSEYDSSVINNLKLEFSSEIASLSKTLTNDCVSKECKFEKIWNYVSNLSYYKPGIKDTSKVIETEMGNCEDFSILFVSLLRLNDFSEKEVFVAHLKYPHTVALVKENESWVMYDPTNKTKGYYDFARIFNDQYFIEGF